jgi:hypothetical protein
MVAESFMKLTFLANLKQRTVSDMPRYIDADKLLADISRFRKIDEKSISAQIALYEVERVILNTSLEKTGAWEKSELDKKQQDMLHHLKRDLHEKAVYSRNKGIDSYIPLKVVDAIINNYLRDLEEKKHSE